jgi:DNA polymerase III subunit delta
MPELKPAYLIHGDDHGAIAERRAGLRALAQGEGGADSVEALEGEEATPAGAATALAAMTLALGRRVILVDGVERWKQSEVQKQLVPALQRMPPDTTLALFAREEGRVKAPAAVHEAVKQAGGQVVAQEMVKPWELPKWARAQAAQMGIELDTAAAKALVAQVGDRQQRLLRELEKLALEQSSPDDPASGGAMPGKAAPPRPIRVSAQDIEARAAHSAEQRAYTLADALVGGDRRASTLTYIRLRTQGERLSGLTYLMAARLRDALAVALRLRAGESAAEVKRGLRMPSKAAERFIADVARSEPDRLREALGVLADLELDTRGGSPLPEARSGMSGLDEETLAVRAIEAIASSGEQATSLPA